MNIYIWRILFGWQKVNVLSHSTDGITTWSARITKWEKLNMDYHLKHRNRADWRWWDTFQYSNEL